MFHNYVGFIYYLNNSVVIFSEQIKMLKIINIQNLSPQSFLSI